MLDVRFLMIVLAVFGSTGCGSGGGGGDGSSSDLVITTPTGPIHAATSTITIDITVTDPQGLPVTVAWSRLSGPLGVAFTAPTTEDPTVTFAANGTYQLQVAASNGSDSTTATLTVEVADPAPFSLAGTVVDDGSPTAEVPVSLLWSPIGVIDNSATNLTGVATFSNLIGRKDRFQVRVGVD